MSEFVVHSRREAVAGIVWLSIGAALSLALEVIYVGSALGWVLAPAGALLFNSALTKTARLWSPKRWVALVPLAVWALGYFAAILLMPALRFTPVPPNLSAVVLLLAGIAGGVYPLTKAE